MQTDNNGLHILSTATTRRPPKAQWLAWAGLRSRADSEALTVGPPSSTLADPANQKLPCQNKLKVAPALLTCFFHDILPL